MFDTLTREHSGATAIGEPIGDRQIRIVVQNRLLHGQLVRTKLGYFDQYLGSVIKKKLYLPCTGLYLKLRKARLVRLEEQTSWAMGTNGIGDDQITDV